MDTLIRGKTDLYRLQKLRGLSGVTVDLTGLKYLGLASHALRLAFFAVREGGTIDVVDKGASPNQSIGPFMIGRPTVKALAVKALGAECQRLSTSDPERLVFQRTAPPLPPGWSAGIVFSGNQAEVPALRRCLDGLTRQAELAGDKGEIVVCGPAAGRPFIREYPTVQYLEFENVSDGPFPISKKKNFLLRSMKFPRRLVLHTRIVLADGALANAPADFDILAPNVTFETERGSEPNLGYICVDPRWPHLVPSKFERSTLHVKPEHYLDLLKTGRPYVDGGAFAVTERVVQGCPLNDGLLWGECEDVEWCLRAEALGYLVDMCRDMVAVNTVSKVRSLSFLPAPVAGLVRYSRRFWRGIENLGFRALNQR